MANSYEGDETHQFMRVVRAAEWELQRAHFEVEEAKAAVMILANTEWQAVSRRHSARVIRAAEV